MGGPGFEVNDLIRVQDLARANRISRNTVTPAVKHLEQLGVLEFNHKAGYRVLRREPTIRMPVREELPLSMAEWAERNACTLVDVYPFPASGRRLREIEEAPLARDVREALGDVPITLLRRIRFLHRRSEPKQRIPIYEEAYVRADALPDLERDFNRAREEGVADFSLFGYYRGHLKTKIRASQFFILADRLPHEAVKVWNKETGRYMPEPPCLFTRLDSVNFCGPAEVSPLERGGCLQYGREYYPSPYFRFRSANRQVDLTFG
jgi:DNA-binding GntR family transcriptional regulator